MVRKLKPVFNYKFSVDAIDQVDQYEFSYNASWGYLSNDGENY